MSNDPPKFLRAVDSGVDGIYIDFRKNFNCVPHLRLLEKINWESKVGGGYSKFKEETSGVPQGSVLGHVLFLLYINECLNGLSCDAVMFAEDVKIWRTIESPSCVQRLQNDMNELSIWSQGPP